MGRPIQACIFALSLVLLPSNAGRAATEDNLLVFYLPDTGAWKRAVARLEGLGYRPATAFNPYWDKNGETFEDPDGYRVVLQNAALSNREQG